MKFCINCNKSVDEKIVLCECGHNFSKQKKKYLLLSFLANMLLGFVLGFFGLFLLYGLFGFMGPSSLNEVTLIFFLLLIYITILLSINISIYKNFKKMFGNGSELSVMIMNMLDFLLFMWIGFELFVEL